MRPRALLLTLLIPLALLVRPVPAQAQPKDGAPRAPAPPPVRLQRGVVVVAAEHAPIDETWNLASEVYRDPALRPRGMDDATARALAGEVPAKRAAPRVRELFELRASLRPEGAPTRRLLASIAGELGVSGVVVVHQTAAHQPRARLFVAKRGDFTPEVLWPQPDASGRPSWASSVAWLSSLTGSSHNAKTEDGAGSVFTSAWFWGALTATAGVIIVGYAASRDEEPASVHLQGRVQP